MFRIKISFYFQCLTLLKVDVYGVKGGRLWGERWTFMG